MWVPLGPFTHPVRHIVWEPLEPTDQSLTVLSYEVLTMPPVCLSYSTFETGPECPSIRMPRVDPEGQSHILASMPPETTFPSGIQVTQVTHL